MANNGNEIYANEDIDAVLNAAVRDNDAGAVLDAIRNGASVNFVHRRCYFPPLFEACKWGAPEEIVRILLNAGANTRWRHEGTGLTAAAAACYNGHLSIVKILINHDKSLLEVKDNNGGTPLFAAIDGKQVEMVRFMINRGANILATNAVGLTPLLRACEKGNVEIVRLLLDAGAEIEARAPGSGGTALHHAVLHGQIEIIRELTLHHNANMSAVNSDQDTPFDVACKHKVLSRSVAAAKDPLIYIYGRKMTKEHGRLALHAVLGTTEYSFLEHKNFHPPQNPLRIILPLGKLTLNRFYDLMYYVNAYLMIHDRDDSGKLPIHIACRSNAPVQVLALLVGHDPATLHMADHNSGALPLHECCRGSVDCYSSVRYLVEQGGVGIVTARDHQGALPLHVLCGSTNPSLRTVQYLMQSFPDAVSTRTYSGEYPFLIAACDKACASLSVVYELVRAYPDLLVSME